MNRSTSKRSKCDPTGDTSLPSVRAGNLLLSRVVLLAMLALWQGGTYIIENPMSSLLPFHPRIAQLTAAFRVCFPVRPLCVVVEPVSNSCARVCVWVTVFIMHQVSN